MAAAFNDAVDTEIRDRGTNFRKARRSSDVTAVDRQSKVES